MFGFYGNSYLMYFMAAVLLAVGVVVGAFIFVFILKRVEVRRTKRALKRTWKATGGTLAGKGVAADKNRKTKRKSRDDEEENSETFKEAPRVSIKDRMVDKSDSQARFNAAAEGRDEQEYLEKLRSRQDRAYNYAGRMEEAGRKEDD